MTAYFEYRHLVRIEDTDLLGTVYYANYVRWQGHCRDEFLREHVPDLLRELSNGLRLCVVSVQCDYLAELAVFDEVAVRMSLYELTQTQIGIGFDYIRLGAAGEQRVARGKQQVACVREKDGELLPERIPANLRHALAPYRNAF